MFLPYKRYRKDVRKAVEEIRNFPSRPSDILICASMKSGRIAFHKYFYEFFIIMKRISGVMVSVFVSSATNRGFEPSQIKDCCICCFFARYMTLRNKSKEVLARNQDYVSRVERDVVSRTVVSEN